MEESINHLVESLKETTRNPDVAAPQLALINTSKEFIQVDTLLLWTKMLPSRWILYFFFLTPGVLQLMLFGIPVNMFLWIHRYYELICRSFLPCGFVLIPGVVLQLLLRDLSKLVSLNSQRLNWLPTQKLPFQQLVIQSQLHSWQTLPSQLQLHWLNWERLQIRWENRSTMGLSVHHSSKRQ